MKNNFKKLFGIGALVLSLLSCNLYLKKDGKYAGIVVPIYEDAKASTSFVNQKFYALTNTSSIKYWGEDHTDYSIQDWYEQEAARYGQTIEIPLSLYPEQIQIPSEFVTENTRRPVQLDELSKYLRNAYPEIGNYDFITFLFNDPSQTFKGYSSIVSDSMVVNNTVRPYINQIVAHEFAHLIGATDKYSKTYSGTVPDYDITRLKGDYDHMFLDSDIQITESTANEIGW